MYQCIINRNEHRESSEFTGEACGTQATEIKKVKNLMMYLDLTNQSQHLKPMETVSPVDL